MPKNQPADTLQNKGNAKKKQTKPNTFVQQKS